MDHESYFWLQFVITICVFSVMLIGGLYTYRYLNDKLTSSNSWFGVIGYSVLLFAALAAIYAAGFIAMGVTFHYLVD